MDRKVSFERRISREGRNRKKIVITGGNGFIGQTLAKTLLQTTTHDLKFDELILVDIEKPTCPVEDSRVRCLVFDLTQEDAFEELFNTNIDIIFHLAAVLSGHAEMDFDLGLKVNIDSTHKLLETIRRQNRPNTRLVYTSSLGVYSWSQSMDREINEMTAVLPKSSYGYQKAISELLINEYTRKGFIDGRVVRLPTVAIRSGSPNLALSSFVSGIIREPLNGQVAICPVDKSCKVWISSPDIVVKNLIHASTLPAEAFGPHRNVILPGITVSIDDMIEAFSAIVGPEVVQLIRFEYDEDVDRFVASLPVSFDVNRALEMGFFRDEDISQIISSYVDSQSTQESDELSSSSSSSSSSDSDE